MKTIPKVKDVVYRRTADGGLYRMLITHDYGDGFLNVTHLDQHITGVSNEKLHHKYFQGRIVKKAPNKDKQRIADLEDKLQHADMTVYAAGQRIGALEKEHAEMKRVWNKIKLQLRKNRAKKKEMKR